MSAKIEELEKAALAEKPWQLSGEATAQIRPENSMLEEDVEFEQASRMGVYCWVFVCFNHTLANNGMLYWIALTNHTSVMFILFNWVV